MSDRQTYTTNRPYIHLTVDKPRSSPLSTGKLTASDISAQQRLFRRHQCPGSGEGAANGHLPSPHPRRARPPASNWSTRTPSTTPHPHSPPPAHSLKHRLPIQIPTPTPTTTITPQHPNLLHHSHNHITPETATPLPHPPQTPANALETPHLHQDPPPTLLPANPAAGNAVERPRQTTTTTSNSATLT